MNIGLEQLSDRSTTFAMYGVVAIVVGAVALSGLPSTAGLVIGWTITGLGAMALQATVVGYLIAGSTHDRKSGSEGVKIGDM